MYWEEEQYYYGEKMIESIQTRVADRFGGLLWKAIPDTYKSGLENVPEFAINYDDLSDASS